MSKGWTYKSGDWNLICDVCGVKTKAGKTRQRWDGFQVCSNCWEPRQSLDFIRARQDKISVPFTRPQPSSDTFVTRSMDYYINDNVPLYDDFTRTVVYARTFSDSFTVSDSFSFTLDLGFADSFSISDSFSHVYNGVRSFSDTATITDTFVLTEYTQLVLNGHALNEEALG